MGRRGRLLAGGSGRLGGQEISLLCQPMGFPPKCVKEGISKLREEVAKEKDNSQRANVFYKLSFLCFALSISEAMAKEARAPKTLNPKPSNSLGSCV